MWYCDCCPGMLTDYVIFWMLSRDADRWCDTDIVTAVHGCWQVMRDCDCCPEMLTGDVILWLLSREVWRQCCGRTVSKWGWCWQATGPYSSKDPLKLEAFPPPGILWTNQDVLSLMSLYSFFSHLCPSMWVSFCRSVSVSLYPPLTLSLSIIDYGSTLWDSASANTPTPLVSLHKRTLKAILLKNTTLAISDYNFRSILPLKERLSYNKGDLYTKLCPEKFHPLLRLNFP